MIITSVLFGRLYRLVEYRLEANYQRWACSKSASPLLLDENQADFILRKLEAPNGQVYACVGHNNPTIRAEAP